MLLIPSRGLTTFFATQSSDLMNRRSEKGCLSPSPHN
jgi:hypothetical protein